MTYIQPNKHLIITVDAIIFPAARLLTVLSSIQVLRKEKAELAARYEAEKFNDLIRKLATFQR